MVQLPQNHHQQHQKHIQDQLLGVEGPTPILDKELPYSLLVPLLVPPPATINTPTAPDDNLDEEDEFNTLIDQMEKAELEEDADGGNSDIEGEEAEIFEESYVRAMIDRNSHKDSEIHVEEINSGDIAFVLADKGVLPEDDQVDLLEKVHTVPDDWTVPVKKEEGDAEPDFEALDNPGNWNSYIFRPVYKKIGKGKDAKYKYIKHELPTGCTPVPMKNGKREVNGWNFFYRGWKSQKCPNARNGAAPDQLFPDSRKSSLDIDLLINLGLNNERMVGPDGLPDALFFLQLILPICDPARSGVTSDPRKAFYSEVTNFTNLYKFQAGIGSTYGHQIPEVALYELVRWDGCLVRDGVLGGGD